MSRSFVVISESAAIVTDCDKRLFEIEEMVGTALCCRPFVGAHGVTRPAFAKNGIKRILRKDVLDIGDQQFLMLLLMMNAENQDRFDYIKQLFVRAGK